MENATVDYNRNLALLEKEVISQAEFQPFELSKKQALEELNASEDALAIVRDGVSKKTGNSSNTLIRSTVNGMVLDVPVEEGFNVIEANNFNDGTTIASVADMENLIFQGQVDESEVEEHEVEEPEIDNTEMITDSPYRIKMIEVIQKILQLKHLQLSHTYYQ